MIFYLHGFRSSPDSSKARSTAEYMQKKGLAAHFFCPQLPESPKESIDLVLKLMKPYSPETITLIGSSLGGFYATWLAEKTGCRAVLLNPVIHPWKIRVTVENPSEALDRKAWENDREKYAGELEELLVKRITFPGRYFLIAAKGDDLLDWQQMKLHYQGAYQIILEESSHSLAEFPQYLDKIFAFSRMQA